MSISTTGFDRAAARYVASMVALTEKRTILLGLRLRRRLAKNTPLRYGRHQASWNLSANSPDRTVKPLDYYNPSGAVEDGNVDVADFRLGGTLIVSNWAPFIKWLDDGHSRQRPAGIVDLTLNEVRAETRGRLY